jgi:hypothetical protein
MTKITVGAPSRWALHNAVDAFETTLKLDRKVERAKKQLEAALARMPNEFLPDYMERTELLRDQYEG